MALGVLQKISPEYVLGKAFMDIKKKGLDGLRPYLTEEANKMVDVIKAVADGMDLLSTVGKLVGGTTDLKEESKKAISFLMDKMSVFDFDYKNMVKDGDTAKAVIAFKYEDVMEGTMDICMIKQDKEWKINNLGMPHFDKLALPIK